MLHSKIAISILTGGQSFRGSVNNVIVISLPKPDLNSIGMQRILATSLDIVYLVLLTGPITDTGNNSVVVVITTTDTIEAESDIIQPTLNSLVLDLNAGSLLLNFSEAVDPSRTTDIVIHNAPQAETSSVVINTGDANVVAEPLYIML